MNGLCHEVHFFHGMFIHYLFFVFGSDGWMNRRRRRRRGNVSNPAIDAAASTGLIAIGGNTSMDALHLAPPLF